MRKLGQHFLVDERILARIIDYAELAEEDQVLEIGPGTGNLTKFLSARSGHVAAIEVDPRLAATLEGRFPNVKLIYGDALKVPFPHYNKVVSNLPYQISSKITFKLLEQPFDLAVLMYQREFAQRMVASPGSKDYGRLTLNVNLRAQVEMMEKVPRGAFRPPPQVESAVIRLRPRKDRPKVDEKLFESLTRGLFNQRRKKVKKGLKTVRVPPDVISRIDISLLERRPQELSLDEVVELTNVISSSSA